MAGNHAGRIRRAQSAAGPGKLRVAVVPFWGRTSWSAYTDAADAQLEKAVRKTVKRQAELELGFSFYRDEPPDGLDVGLERVWESRGSKRVARETELARIGSALSVDAVISLTYWLTGYSADRMDELEVVVYGVSKKKLYSKVGGVGERSSSNWEERAAAVIRSALTQCLEARRQKVSEVFLSSIRF